MASFVKLGLGSVMALAIGCTQARAQLVCGNDQLGSVIYMVDVSGNSPPRTLVTGGAALCAAVAADEVGRVLYWSSGTQIYRAAYQNQGQLTPVLIGGVSPSMTGLAYDTQARKLYGRGSDGIYEINLTNAALTRVFLASAQDFGGFDYDPASDTFYGCNDSTITTLIPGRGLYRINKPLSDPSFTLLSIYPAGEFDVDGLAAGGGRLYLVNDVGAQPIYVYDLATSRYLASIPSPFTSTNGAVNCGAAWAPGMFQAGPTADIALTCTDAPDPVIPPGGLLTYTLQVQNTGPSSATSVMVSGSLPPGVTLSAASPPGVVVSGQYSAALGDLASGATSTLTLRVATSGADVLSFTPSVTSTQFDPNQFNNSVVVTTTVRPPQADLAISAQGPGPCVRGSGDAVTYTIQFTNQGPDAEPGAQMAITLPAGAQFLSSTAPLSGSGSNYLFGPVALTPGQSQGLSLSVVATTPGPNLLTLSSLGTLADPVASNSDLALTTIIAGTPPGASPVRGVLSTLSSSPTSLVPGLSGVRFSSVGGFGRPFKSESGSRWIMHADTDAPGASDAMLLAGTGTLFQMVAREGTFPLLPTSPARTFRPFGSFDPVQGINDAGQFVFSGLDARVDTTTDGYVVAWDGSEFRLVMQEGSPAPAVGPGAIYGSSRGSATIRADGSTSFFASLGGTGVTASNDQGIFIADGTQLVQRKGLTVPLGQTLGGTFSYKSFDAGTSPGLGFFPDAFASRWALAATINASPNSPPPGGMDRVAINDNTVIVQENALVSGTGIFSPARDTTPFVALSMEPDGTSFCIGGSESGLDWVLRNGFPIAQSASQIAPGESPLWTRPDGAPNTFLLALGDRLGNSVVGGFTSGSGLETFALVLNGNRVILRGNDPVDLDNNGLFDDAVYVRDVKPYHGFLGDDGFVYVVVQLRGNDAANCGGIDTSLGEALIRVPLNPVVIVPCDPDVNQDGNADQIDIDYLINVVAGGENTTGIDPDFNRDGNADQIDIDALLNVVAGGACP